MAYGQAPQIAGVELRKPSSVSETPERRFVDVELAGGRIARYDGGRRFVVSLSWASMETADVDALEALLAPAVVSYRHIDGITYTVLSDAPQRSPIPGTSPPRSAVTLELREQTVR